jgi:hypothetical protein
VKEAVKTGEQYWDDECHINIIPDPVKEKTPFIKCMLLREEVIAMEEYILS